MIKRVLYVSTLFLLAGCSTKQASVDTSVQSDLDTHTPEEVEEVVTEDLPLIVGSWTEESTDEYGLGLEFLEIEEDYARFSVIATDNVIQGPLIKKEQTQDTLTLWMYEEKMDTHEIPASIVPISFTYEDIYGEIQLKSGEDWFVPAESTALDLNKMNLIANDIPEYSIERTKELQGLIDTYLPYEQAEALFQEKVKDEDPSAERAEYNSESIYFSDDDKPFYSISYLVGESQREYDFIVFADTGETEIRKSSDKLYTFQNEFEETATSTDSDSAENILNKYNKLDLALKVILAATTVDERAMSPNLDGFDLYYNFDNEYLLVNVHSGVGSGHPVYLLTYDRGTITPLEGVVYTGITGYEDVSVGSNPVSKKELYDRYMAAKESYDTAVKKVMEAPEMTVWAYEEMRHLINE